MEATNLQLETECKRQAGRPRSEVARRAILDSAYSFLEEKPIAEISTIHIAQKAGVSTATVYRWWQTKEALLLEALLYRHGHEVVLGDLGTPLERLRDYVMQVARFFTGEHGIVVARLLTAIQDNATLRKEFVERIYTPRDRDSREVVEAAIREGQLPAATQVDLFLDTVFGTLLTRLLIRHEPIDEAYVLSAFELVVAGTNAVAASAATPV
ncbi:MAG: TetR/AcrR family transcriptional regulator C-terminal ligand-binding domain-containing protein [Terracidiphilus sp.]|nr:TetR/AcrR family transcriptional regulator C-terminal ligand-binding domain-containing protein [Terracidiphilus sp.]